MLTRRNSLGAYPTDSYYDPNRPSWLPYWIDDDAESSAKYNKLAVAVGIPSPVTTQQILNPNASYPLPPAGAAPGVPAGAYTNVQYPTGMDTESAALTAAQTKANAQGFFNTLAVSLTNAANAQNAGTPWLLYGIIGVGALLVGMKLFGGR